MFEKANKIIEDFGHQKLAEAQSSGRSMGITHAATSPNPDDSLGRMKVSFARRAGDLITAIRFTLRRNLFYAYYGAGRGQGGKKGSVWTNAAGERRKTAPSSLGKAGTGNRDAKPFLDVISRDADDMLAEVAAANMDEIMDNSFKIFK